jgi:hypothetical protein
MALRHDLIRQMPGLKKKYLKYESYKDQTVSDIFTAEQMKGAIRLDAYNLATSILINEGDLKFKLKALPTEAQFSPVYAIEVQDFDDDGHPDILLGGNLFKVKPEVGRYDASNGLLLRGNGKNEFEALSSVESGVNMDGEIRDFVTINTTNSSITVVSRNSNSLVIYTKNSIVR